MLRTIRKLAASGDDLVAEWNPETVSAERLAEIEQEFNGLMQRGYVAADITDGRNTLVEQFDANADLLMLPKVCGGSSR